MCQASDTVATNHICTTFVAKLTKLFDVAEQAQGEPLKRRREPIA